MARTKGSKNRIKIGDPRFNMNRPKKATKLPHMSTEEIMDTKHKILELLSSGDATTISEAARSINVEPHKVYTWGRSDPDFREAVTAAREVVADDIEKRLQNHPNFIPLMFLLKAYRPEFRENYRYGGTDSKLEEILGELSRKAQEEPLPTPEPEKVEKPPEPWKEFVTPMVTAG